MHIPNSSSGQEDATDTTCWLHRLGGLTAHKKKTSAKWNVHIHAPPPSQVKWWQHRSTRRTGIVVNYFHVLFTGGALTGKIAINMLVIRMFAIRTVAIKGIAKIFVCHDRRWSLLYLYGILKSIHSVLLALALIFVLYTLFYFKCNGRWPYIFLISNN